MLRFSLAELWFLRASRRRDDDVHDGHVHDDDVHDDDDVRGLGAEVRPVPAVPYKDEMNYNHQAKVCTAIQSYSVERRPSARVLHIERNQKSRMPRTGDRRVMMQLNSHVNLCFFLSARVNLGWMVCRCVRRRPLTFVVIVPVLSALRRGHGKR